MEYIATDWPLKSLGIISTIFSKQDQQQLSVGNEQQFLLIFSWNPNEYSSGDLHSVENKKQEQMMMMLMVMMQMKVRLESQ